MEKLKEFKYAFVYKDEDLTKGKISIKFKRKAITTSTKIKDGLFINLIAYDKNNDEYEINMLLNLDNKELDNIPNKFVNISDKVCFIDFYRPNLDNSPDILLGNIDDLYSNPGNIWMLKESDNTYFFKISVPEEKLFIWFYLEKDMIVNEQ